MAQYSAIKAEHKDAILFFRLGDFYEMFHDDAKLAAEELQIVLTARDKGSENPTPMAGVPFHSYRSYAAKLLKKGYKVAICEQIGEPDGKGPVERRVVRVLTSGTLLEEDWLKGGVPNYLACLTGDRTGFALVQVDVSTGEAYACVVPDQEGLARLVEELLRARPAELLLQADLETLPEVAKLLAGLDLPPGAISRVEPGSRPSAAALRTFFGGTPPPVTAIDPGLGRALGVLHAYLARTHGESFGYFTKLELRDLASRMQLDPATVRNLELTETLIDRSAEGSLLAVLDRTATSMGSRLLRAWMLHPLTDRGALVARYDAVEALVRSLEARRRLREALKGVYDIPRCLGRLASPGASPRDLALLRASLTAFPELHAAAGSAGLGAQADGLLGFEDLARLLADALVDSPPHALAEGGVIRPGYSHELDQLRDLQRSAEGWIQDMEERERAATGIKSLKIRFNRVMGYFIEITKANLGEVPAHYTRKQTLVNGERYITPALKAKEDEVLTAEEKAKALEAELFKDLRERVAERFAELQRAGQQAATLDVLQALAARAEEKGWVRPTLVEGARFAVEDGRHPVVEELAPDGSFVPNSLDLDPAGGTSLVLLTGPNMSGKSTFLRQTALIQLMAQMGSFVPAREATLGLVDRIFTRVGASDDLSRGESTFMVEMRETAFILEKVTPRSLVILDEVGRGTATWDGLSLAWAIVEHLAQTRAKVLFATHYHELTALEDKLPSLANLSVSVEEKGEDILFLHRVVRGPADKSYGIHVARLAGFPEAVVRRARVLLEELERGSTRQVERLEAEVAETKGEAAHRTPAPPAPRARRPEAGGAAGAVQLTLFRSGPDPVVEELAKLDPMNMTPLQALAELVRLKGLVSR